MVWWRRQCNTPHCPGVVDDCFDTDEGYRGTLQYIVCVQSPETGDNGTEASNTGAANLDLVPRAKPRLANFTFVGNANYANGKGGSGMRFKEGNSGIYTNGVIVNFDAQAVDFDDYSTAGTNPADGSTNVMTDIYMFGNGEANASTLAKNIPGDKDQVEVTAATSAGAELVFQDPGLPNIALGSSLNLVPGTRLTCDSASMNDSAFESADYCGAFDNVNWMADWTTFVQN